jgi:L-amino acid N-acyltransferase YncA
VELRCWSLVARRTSEKCAGCERHHNEGFHRPNENKMSDGWRESASLPVEGGISWKITNQSCQPFAPSSG